MNKEAPCFAVCMIDPHTSLCFGRGRALPIATDPAHIAASLEASCHEAPADLAVLAGRGRRCCSQESGADRACQTALFRIFAPAEPVHTVQIPRGSNGEFAVQTRINGIAAPMVVDTGATSVVLTYETAKAVGLPLELLEYNVDVQTASGQTKAARLWLDRMAIGKLVERSVQALVVPRGQMKTNLLGMSFLDRLDGFEVRAGHLMLRGFQEPATLRSDRRSSIIN